MMRNYKNIIDRLKNLQTFFSLELLTYDSLDDKQYPIFKIHLGNNNPKKKRVLISAGIHGDEPAGIETICSVLERKIYIPFLKEWEIFLLPCLNPSGYEQDDRLTRAGNDLNRLFKTIDPPTEVKAIKTILSNSFDLSLELHEDYDSSGYYLYIKGILESFLNLGREILDNVEDVMPINKESEIDNQSSNNGMIYLIKDLFAMDWWPMAAYASKLNIPCIFTLETPSSFPLDTRVKAHTRAICTVLDKYSNHI